MGAGSPCCRNCAAVDCGALALLAGQGRARARHQFAEPCSGDCGVSAGACKRRDRLECDALGWSARAGVSRGRAEPDVRGDGDGSGSHRAALLHRLHGAQPRRHALLCADADLHRGHGGAGVQRQPLCRVPVLGTDGFVLLQPGGLLVSEEGIGCWGAQGAADDPPGRLWIAGRNPPYIYAHGQRAMDRSRRCTGVYRRSVLADAGSAAGKVGTVSAAYVDSRSDECTDTGERVAACGLLRKGWCLSGGADALLQPVASQLGPDHDVAGHGDHGGGRGLRHGAARPEAHAGLPYGEPDWLHHYRNRTGHAAGDCRGAAALPESQSLQGWTVSGCGQRAARHRHTRHE